MKSRLVNLTSALTLSLLPLFCSSALATPSIISATGMGTVDLQAFPNKPQARMMAKRAALVDAQRVLAESIKGVKLSGGTTVEEMEVTSDIVATRVKGMLRGAFILEQKLYEEGGSYVVETEIGVCFDKSDNRCANQPTLDELTELIGTTK